MFDLLFLENLIKSFMLIKIGFLIIDFFYVIFSIILLNQVFAMNNIIREDGNYLILQYISFLYIILGISLFVISLAIL
jgi:hypothetical protein